MNSLFIDRWPNLPPEFGGVISRRTEELYGILDASLDDGGLFEALVLPLRDIVLYPKLLTPLFVVHEPSLLAVEEAIRAQETMIGIALTDPDTDNPGPQDFYAVGTEIAVGRLRLDFHHGAGAAQGGNC